MKRRGFLTKLFVGALAAPSIVRAAITKPISPAPKYFVGNIKSTGEVDIDIIQSMAERLCREIDEDLTKILWRGENEVNEM